MLTPKQKEQLRSENLDYHGMCKTLEDYADYQKYYALYFCIRVGDADYEYSETRAAQNVQFIQSWPEKKAKIKARLAKNSYFRGGRASDERDLKKGEAKYAGVTRYFQLHEEFENLKNMLENGLLGEKLSLEEYISKVRKKRRDMEDGFEKELKKRSSNRNNSSESSPPPSMQ